MELENDLKFMHGIGMTKEELEKQVKDYKKTKKQTKKFVEKLSESCELESSSSWDEDIRIGDMVYHVAQQGEESSTGWYLDETSGYQGGA